MERRLTHQIGAEAAHSASVPIVGALLTALMLTACGDGLGWLPSWLMPAGSTGVAAQVGEARLMVQEVKLQMPIGLTADDSLTFCRDYIDAWVTDQLLYQQGVRHLPDIDQKLRQVEEYRHYLIGQSYLQQLADSRLDAVTDEEVQAYYDASRSHLKLDRPIVKGVCIKLPATSGKVKELRRQLEQILAGDTEYIEPLEQYCQQRAASYDNFMDHWVDFARLADMLPVTVADASTFLRVKVYELRDADFVWLALVSDYRLAGETQPIDYARVGIAALLQQQQRQHLRDSLVVALKEASVESGYVKINWIRTVTINK